MAWPASVVTRKISFGSAVVLETGEDLSLTVATKANRALVSMGQGFRMESYIFTMTSGVAEEVVFDLPVTNQTGWMDAETRQPLTVGADVHSHLYTTTLTIKRGGEVLKSYTVGPYALPQGAGVLDGDTMLVKDPVSGITLTIPEAWQQVIDSANAIVTDLPGAMAQHASDGSAFNLALSSTIADAVAGVSSDVVTLVRPDHLRRFRSALGRARFSQTHVVIEGDSVVAGGDSGDEVPVTAAQKLKALIRGWASQVRAGISSLLGIDAGEGWVGLAGDEGRWSFTGAAPSPGAYGPVATGARLSAGNDATATGQDFRYVDFVGYTGGAVTHPPRIEIDDADVRPTALNADAKNGVVAAGKWAAIGTNTTITQPAPRRIRLTAVGTGTVRADFGDATGDFAVTAGEWLLFTVAAIAPAARQGGVSAYFYNDAGTQIGSEIPVNATSGAGTYAQSTGFVQVPAG
ncbi:MAG TPA: hypothetical protein VN108_03910, partial [Marmoricola sp.]|nr:hypothetical protein [Marmoricola sp.]